MKQHSTFIIRLAKVFFSFLRALIALRYKVEVKGSAIMEQTEAKLILPNHQAIMDPILLFAHLYRYTTAVPVITSSYYDMPVARSVFSAWGAVRVSDLESGSRNTNVLEQIVKSVSEGFVMDKNIVLYPSGQIAGQGYERIVNKQSAYRVVKELPANVSVVAVRINGFWGSRWSKAWTGRSPDFATVFLKSALILLSNLFFFAPRRRISIEFIDISAKAITMSQADKTTFNTCLEDVYNANGPEPEHFLKAHFLLPALKRSLPDRIAGSESEDSSPSGINSITDIPDAVQTKVKACISKVLELSPDEIQTNAYLQLDLGADSLNLVEILSEVENDFDTFSAPQINELKTVADLCLAATGQFKSQADLPVSGLTIPFEHSRPLKIKAAGSITELMIRTLSEERHSPFLYDSMLGTTSRKDFFLKANVVAELLKLKVPEKSVGIMLPALQSTTLLIAACYLSGKVPVMLNWTVGNKVLEHCIATAGIGTILSAGTFIDKIIEMLPGSIHGKLMLLEKEVPKIGLATKLKGALKAQLPSFIARQKADDTAVILFTSGSEALPKAVPLSHRNIVSDLAAVFDMVDVDNDEIFLSFLPPFHSFGFTVMSILPLISGVRTAYTPNPTDAREVLRILKHVQANILVGTPGFLKLLLVEGSPYHFKSVHYAISGAEAMPAQLREDFMRMTRNALVLEGYGITECAPVISLNPQKKQKLNSVGLLLPGLSGLILDPDTGEKLAPSQPGMIYISGPNVFDGYLDQPGLKPFRTIDGRRYYTTGDIGYFDEEGYLFITGRLKRFIKIAGEMISLPFIESILMDQYGGNDEQTLAIEGSDKTTPSDIVLFSTRAIDLSEVNQYLLQNGVAAIAKIKRVIIVDEIPKLGTGKINYRELRKRVEDGMAEDR